MRPWIRIGLVLLLVIHISASKLPVSVVVTAHDGIYTLRRVLDSYVANGLFDSVSEVILVYSEMCAVDSKAFRALAKYPFSHIVGTPHNTFVSGTFDLAARLATHDIVLVLQQDFELTADASKTKQSLIRSYLTIKTGVADLVSLRSRTNPGVPLWAHHYYGNSADEMFAYSEVPDQACQVPFWMNDAQVNRFVAKHGIDMWHDPRYDFWITHANVCYFNEQASMFSKVWFLRTFAKTLTKLREQPYNTTYHNHHGLEIATRYSRDGPWLNRMHYVALGSPGIFTHNDYDKFPHDGIAQSYIPPMNDRSALFYKQWLGY